MRFRRHFAGLSDATTTGTPVVVTPTMGPSIVIGYAPSTPVSAPPPVPTDPTSCGAINGSWNPNTNTCSITGATTNPTGPAPAETAAQLSGNPGSYYSAGPCPSNYTLQYPNSSSSMCTPNPPSTALATTLSTAFPNLSTLIPNFLPPPPPAYASPPQVLQTKKVASKKKLETSSVGSISISTNVILAAIVGAALAVLLFRQMKNR